MHRTASCLQRGGVGGKPGMWCVGKNGWFGGNLESLLKRGKCLVVKIQHLAVVFFGGDDVYYIYILIIGTLLKGISLMIFVGGSFVDFCESVVSYARWMGVEVRDQQVGFSHLKSQLP